MQKKCLALNHLNDERVPMENNVKLTGWSNEPTVDNLKQDLNNCKASYSHQVAIIDRYMDELRADNLKPRKDKTSC